MLFKLDENKQATQDLVEKDAKMIKFVDSHYAKVDSIKDLLGEFPSPNGVYFLWTMKSFNAFTFITYTIRYQKHIEELTVSTYGINTRIVNALFNWIDKGAIQKVNFFMSESAKYRIPKVLDLIDSMSQSRPGKVNLFFGWNHSKITLMKTQKHRFVVAGSGNFSENARHEQYMFADSPELFDFYHKNIMQNEIHARTD